MHSRLMVAAAVATALGGCESIEQPLRAWTDENIAPSPASATSSLSAETFSVAEEGLAVHDAPSGSSKVIGRLGLHEIVTRSRLEHGYAYITAAPQGLQGWVDNAQLVGRQPQPTIAGHSTRPIAPEPGPAPLRQSVATATGVTGTDSEAAIPPPAGPVFPPAGPEPQDKPVASARAEAEMVDPF